VVGKTIPHVGRLSIAPYRGNGDVLVDPRGREENTGWMVAFDRGFHPVDGPEGTFNRFVVAADYASGDNALGGLGLALSTYFTPNVSLLVGPTWFNAEEINGETKWTVQLDINQSWFDR
jgi:hypothetical protein